MIYKRIGCLIFLLSLWGCSLSLDTDKSYSLFFNPSGDGSDFPALGSSALNTVAQYTKTCFLLSGAGEFHQSEIKSLNIQYDVTGTQIEMVWLEFDIPRLAAGRKYSIELFGFKTLPASVTKCPEKKDLNNLKPYARLGSLNFNAPKTDSKITLDYDFKEYTRDDDFSDLSESEEESLSW